MNPNDVIFFMLIGLILLLAIGIAWFIFRNRKKWAMVVSGVLVIGYVGYYLYFPTIKVNTHAQRYEQIVDYLEATYPDQEFKISPVHFEEGYTVGQFDVQEVSSKQGVTLRVDRNGNVTQISTWYK
ncbi:LPXTG cell wall anchor domain-containing protein [Chungangia koreensis]|uniref:LPXTG cell wall anchor domain-containing protein n=1 Tax=Chungangia koreensis TaxID=752657 RepID=A0ABV8X048_9LACT